MPLDPRGLGNVLRQELERLVDRSNRLLNGGCTILIASVASVALIAHVRKFSFKVSHASRGRAREPPNNDGARALTRPRATAVVPLELP